MRNTEDIKAKIDELRAVGSPSALSKASELEWVLGITEAPDEESDMLTDMLLSSVQKPSKSLWDQLPVFAHKHQFYTFYKQQEAIKEKSVPLPSPKDTPGPKSWTQLMGHATDEEKRKLELARLKTGKAFRWKDVLGMEGAKALYKKLKKENSEDTYDEGFYTRIPDKAASLEEAELVASLTETGTHRPLLDIDFPAVVVPSSTEGHCHLYIDKELTWKEYKKLLNLLADLGIIENGYRGASLARGYSALRLPWISKEKVGEVTLPFEG